MPFQQTVTIHTVRAPQVRSTMHDENTINTSETISVSIRAPKRENALRLCWDVDRRRTGICSRKDDRFVANPISGQKIIIMRQTRKIRFLYLLSTGLQHRHRHKRGFMETKKKKLTPGDTT